MITTTDLRHGRLVTKRHASTVRIALRRGAQERLRSVRPIRSSSSLAVTRQLFWTSFLPLLSSCLVPLMEEAHSRQQTVGLDADICSERQETRPVRRAWATAVTQSRDLTACHVLFPLCAEPGPRMLVPNPH